MKILFAFAIAVTSLVTAFSPLAAKETDQNVDTRFEKNDDIIVIGEIDRRKRVETFLKATMKPSREDQFARYAKPICPTARGLSADFNAVIEQRMRRVADAASIRVKKEGCKANIALLVVHEPKKMMDELRDNYPGIFGEMSTPARDRIIDGPGPTYAWQDVETRSAGGTKAAGLAGAMVLDSGIKGMSSIGGSTRSVGYGGSNSRYRLSTRLDMNLSVLLIDIKMTEGVELRQIADYALMRLAANVEDKAGKEMPEQSILQLFSDPESGVERTQSVTAWDFLLLKSLYKTKPNRTAARQRNMMSRIFEKEIEKQAKKENAGTN